MVPHTRWANLLCGAMTNRTFQLCYFAFGAQLIKDLQTTLCLCQISLRLEMFVTESAPCFLLLWLLWESCVFLQARFRCSFKQCVRLVENRGRGPDFQRFISNLVFPIWAEMQPKWGRQRGSCTGSTWRQPGRWSALPQQQRAHPIVGCRMQSCLRATSNENHKWIWNQGRITLFSRLAHEFL